MAWASNHVNQTYCCNKELLKHFRERRGWTQVALADIAGYSDRLISKAEAGHSISSDTIVDLAEALSTNENPVYPEDLICDPEQFAKQYIDAVYLHPKEVVKHIRAFLDDDVVFQISGDPKSIPFAGTHRGAAGVEKLFEIFFSILEIPKNHDHRPHYQYIAQGNEVVAWGDCWIHPIGQPMDSPIRVTNLFQFRRGKLVFFDDRYDTQSGAEMIAHLVPPSL